MPWPSLATWADLLVAGGTGALAFATFRAVKAGQRTADETKRLASQTARLVEDGRQPVLVPEGGARCQWNTTDGLCRYWLPVRNVGKGVAVIRHDGGTMLVDSQDPLRLSYPGDVIIAPDGAQILELVGRAKPVPVFSIALEYSDVRLERVSQTRIPFNKAEADWRMGNGVFELNLVAMHPVFIADV